MANTALLHDATFIQVARGSVFPPVPALSAEEQPNPAGQVVKPPPQDCS
jgi:hypothetical protein